MNQPITPHHSAHRRVPESGDVGTIAMRVLECESAILSHAADWLGHRDGLAEGRAFAMVLVDATRPTAHPDVAKREDPRIPYSPRGRLTRLTGKSRLKSGKFRLKYVTVLGDLPCILYSDM